MNTFTSLTRTVAVAMLVAAPQIFAVDAEKPKAPSTELEVKLEARVKELEARVKQLEQELNAQAKDQDMFGEFRQRHNFGRDFDDIFNKLQRELDRDLGPGVNPFGFVGPRGTLGNKPRLGVELAEPSDELRERFKNDIKEGAFVMSVVPGSPAAKAGLSVGDAVTSFNTKGVGGPRDLIDAVKNAPQGKNEIVVTRRGESLKLKVDLGEVQAEAEDTDFQPDARQGWIRRGDPQQPNAGGNTRSRTEVKASALELNEDLAKTLKLTDEQRKKMNDVLANHAKALNEDVANSQGGARKQRRNGAFAFNIGGDVNRMVEKHAEEAEKELTGTLSADQIAKWSDYRKTHNSVSVSHSTMIENGGGFEPQNGNGNRSRVDDPALGF
jgi:hypothetical protein